MIPVRDMMKIYMEYILNLYVTFPKKFVCFGTKIEILLLFIRPGLRVSFPQRMLVPDVLERSPPRFRSNRLGVGSCRDLCRTNACV